MARIRSIKPDVWTDPEFVACSPLARLLWIGSWNHADDYGVLKDDPERLRLQILPGDQSDPHALVDELVARRFLVRRLAEDGTRVLVIRTFCVHQKIDSRATGRWGHPDTFTDPPQPATPQPSPPEPNQSQPIPPVPAGSQPSPTIRREGKGKERDTFPSSPPALTLVPVTASPSATEVATSRFEDHFWPVFPKRHGRRAGKAKALERWKRLGVDDQRAAVRGAKNYATWCENTSTFAMDASRWLKEHAWTEYQDQPAVPPPEKPPVYDPVASLPNRGALTYSREEAEAAGLGAYLPQSV